MTCPVPDAWLDTAAEERSVPWLVLLLAELDDEAPELDDVDEVAAGLGVELAPPPVLDEPELDAVMTRGAEAVGSGAE